MQGGGEHAKVVLDCLLDLGADVLALFDPQYEGALFGVRQMGVYDPAFAPEAKAIIAIGNNEVRKRVASLTRHTFTHVIHSSAQVSTRIQVGTGSMLLQGSLVQANSHIGDHVIINTASSVDHDCEVGHFVHIAPRAVLCGRVKIGEGTLVGAGAVILPGVTIGEWATIGAGSVVIHDVPSGVTVAGNPARIIKKTN